MKPAFDTLRWVGDPDGHLELLDQTLLPGKTDYLSCRDLPTVWDAIKRLVVRGAPAIGIAAAYGVVIGVQGAKSKDDFQAKLDHACEYLASSRPTAVNLFWALERMKRHAAKAEGSDVAQKSASLLEEAIRIHDEDRAMCESIGRFAAALIPCDGGVLTHCNAGALATGGIGTATAPMYLAHEQGKAFKVYADETRPLLQGARLTAWELGAAGIDVTLITDSMAAQVMRSGKIQMVITGADRIAANGDVANKIGTYSLAVLAQAHEIPFYVAAPVSTFDMSLPAGEQIPIEQRAAEEVTNGFGRRTAPDTVNVYSPAFDVTPNNLITAIITDQGIIRPVTTEAVRTVLNA